jgi:hypothetical protein
MNLLELLRMIQSWVPTNSAKLLRHRKARNLETTLEQHKRCFHLDQIEQHNPPHAHTSNPLL